MPYGRIVFFGTSEIAIPTLQFLSVNGLVGVVTQPDHGPFGPVKRVALEFGVPILQPDKVRDAVAEIQALKPDLIVVLSYGQILPKAILEMAKACLNLHASLLPRHRGASPIQAAILSGDIETGMTVMHMAPGLDDGDILLRRVIPIASNETGGSLHDRLAVLAVDALRDALDGHRPFPRTPQEHNLANMTRKLSKEQGAIDWTQSAVQIERVVRAYNPFPGAHCLLGGKPLKIHAAEVVDGTGSPGAVVCIGKDFLDIGTGTGLLRLREVQSPGKKRMWTGDWLRGARLQAT